jgi:hypothetical protein
MSRLAKDSNSAPIQCLRPGATQTVSVSGTAASDYYIPSNTVEFIHTYSGDTISFITGGSTGTAYVSEMN